MNTQICYAQIIALCSMFFHMDNGTKDDLGPNRNDVRDFQKWGDMQTKSPKDAFAAVKRLGKYRSTQLKGLLQSNQLDPSLADNWSHVMNSAKLGDCAPEKDIRRLCTCAHTDRHTAGQPTACAARDAVPRHTRTHARTQPHPRISTTHRGRAEAHRGRRSGGQQARSTADIQRSGRQQPDGAVEYTSRRRVHGRRPRPAR
eukprot:COSAG01_NODE_10847_length_2068_cov_31.607415_1_plen_201_part_00